jgi:hypothetical protein
MTIIVLTIAILSASALLLPAFSPRAFAHILQKVFIGFYFVDSVKNYTFSNNIQTGLDYIADVVYFPRTFFPVLVINFLLLGLTLM